MALDEQVEREGAGTVDKTWDWSTCVPRRRREMRGFSRGGLDPGLKGESPRPGGRGQGGGHADDGGEDEEEEEHCLQ